MQEPRLSEFLLEQAELFGVEGGGLPTKEDETARLVLGIIAEEIIAGRETFTDEKFANLDLEKALQNAPDVTEAEIDRTMSLRVLKEVQSMVTRLVLLFKLTGHEGDNDVGGMPVEVLPPAVIDRGRPGVGMSSGDLDITEGNPSVEGGHDERRPEHVRVDGAETCLLPDGAHPAVGGSPIESLPILSLQDAPSVRSPMARSIVRAALGTRGITAGLLPFP